MLENEKEDQALLEKTNPVFNTAKTTLFQLARNGNPYASAIVEKMGLTADTQKSKSFSMSRQAFINDDIGFLTEVPGLYATAAKKTIDKQVYKLL